MNNKCRNCMFVSRECVRNGDQFNETADDFQYVCRRHPSVPMYDSRVDDENKFVQYRRYYFPSFPIVNENDVCGEYRQNIDGDV